MKAMKILAIVFGVLTVLLGVAPVVRDTSLASEISSLGAFGGLMDAAGLPSAGHLYLAMGIALILTVSVIVGIIFAIKKNPKLMVVSYAILGLAIVSILAHPSVKLGFGAASPREIAVFHAIPALLAGVCLLVFARKANTV